MNNSRWLEVSARLGGLPGILDTSGRICTLAVELLEVDHASIGLVILGRYESVGNSSELALLLEEQQFALGDGPAFVASTYAEPILVDDIATQRERSRWPIFAELAERHLIRAVHAFPLRIGGAHIGVLTLFTAKPHSLSATQYADGLLLASLAAAELVRLEAARLAQAPQAVEVAEIYEQSSLQLAAGMVAEALNCSVLEGLVRIRARAFADDLPVAQIAKAVLAKTIVIEK